LGQTGTASAVLVALSASLDVLLMGATASAATLSALVLAAIAASSMLLPVAVGVLVALLAGFDVLFVGSTLAGHDLLHLGFWFETPMRLG
jgi:hypothetical protein